jgi:hypothetical protein
MKNTNKGCKKIPATETFFTYMRNRQKNILSMKITTILAAITLFLYSHMAMAGTPGADYAMGAMMCTQVNADQLHLSCKLSDANTGDQAELAGIFINYDVKNSEGAVIASGYGNTVNLDHNKLTIGEEYSIIIYALVNGNVESQTFTRRQGDK